MMSIESLMQAVLQASPQKRRELEAVLSGTAPKPQIAKSDLRLVSISGAAKLLAISRTSVYGLLKQHRIDKIMISGAPKITMQSLSELIDGQRPENAVTATMIEASQARYANSQQTQSKKGEL